MYEPLITLVFVAALYAAVWAIRLTVRQVGPARIRAALRRDVRS